MMRFRSDRGRVVGLSVSGPWWFQLLMLPFAVAVDCFLGLRDLIESGGWASLIGAAVVVALLAGVISWVGG
jgi:hypothetical protein